MIMFGLWCWGVGRSGCSRTIRPAVAGWNLTLSYKLKSVAEHVYTQTALISWSLHESSWTDPVWQRQHHRAGGEETREDGVSDTSPSLVGGLRSAAVRTKIHGETNRREVELQSHTEHQPREKRHFPLSSLQFPLLRQQLHSSQVFIDSVSQPEGGVRAHLCFLSTMKISGLNWEVSSSPKKKQFYFCRRASCGINNLLPPGNCGEQLTASSHAVATAQRWYDDRGVLQRVQLAARGRKRQLQMIKDHEETQDVWKPTEMTSQGDKHGAPPPTNTPTGTWLYLDSFIFTF